MSNQNDQKPFTVIKGGKDDQPASSRNDFSKAVDGDDDAEMAGIREQIDSFFNFEGERFDF